MVLTELQASLLDGELSVMALVTGIILLSYLLEDLAIVTAATLAARESLSPSLALIAIFIGIASGDLGLYIVGRYGRRVRILRYRALKNRHFKMLRFRFQQHAFLNLFIIRFVPGLRGIGFTLGGFFNIRLGLFLCAVLSATAIWTSLIFASIYYLGTQAWMQASHYQWLLIPLAVAVLYMINRILNHSLSKGHV
jgi:membrane protein DedA with SNARE-associated domain